MSAAAPGQAPIDPWRALRLACEGLERICMGTADEADSSSIAEKTLFAAIGHAEVSSLAALAAPAAAAPEQPATADVNDLPVTPAAGLLYALCSVWTREAFRIPWMLGEKDPRAEALEACAAALRDTVNGLRRAGDL